MYRSNEITASRRMLAVEQATSLAEYISHIKLPKNQKPPWTYTYLNQYYYMSTVSNVFLIVCLKTHTANGSTNTATSRSATANPNIRKLIAECKALNLNTDIITSRFPKIVAVGIRTKQNP